MREIRLYGSEGGGAARSPYPYQSATSQTSRPKGSWCTPVADRLSMSCAPFTTFGESVMPGRSPHPRDSG
jgi:hypothetical protein